MSEFVEYLSEVFAGFGEVRARRMFGGYGIYHDGTMFALVADDTLYLKADETEARRFRARGLPQFEYVKAGKRVKLSYFMAPDEVFDDPDTAAQWARHSFEAALRAR